MRIELLGPLVVTTDTGPLAIAASKERALLARLALDAGRTVSVGSLIGALWGEQPPATAVKTLQTYVARLRRTLPPGSIGTGAGGYILTVDRAGVDVFDFEEAVGEGRTALRAHDPASATAAFGRALSLWRGDPLPDLDDHLTGQSAAARLRELRLAAEEDDVDARLSSGAAGDLVARLEAAVRDEPLRERRWSQLMLALYRSGRQAEALRAYRRARTMLAEQLGVDPGADLRALEQAILDHDPALLGDGGRPPPTALASGLAAITTGPIAGRAHELDIIAGQWRAVRAGACRAVVIHGEPGIGKTRLLGEAARLAHRDGALVLFGRCDREAFTPYQAIIDALRSYVQTIPRAALHGAPGWELAELARVAPEAGARLGTEPGPLVDEPSARQRLFDAIAGFLARQRGEQPLVLTVDDLQWIDGTSAALLRHLVRAIPRRMLLLASHRSGDAESDRRLADALAQLPPASQPAPVALGALDEDAVRELAGDDGAAVHAASGGSPLFVAELLRYRASTGHLPADDEVPAGVRQAVDRRLAGLDAATLRLVEVAAVAGASTPIAELAIVCGLAESAVTDLVDRAITAHVFAEQPAAPGSAVFTHELVRASLLQALTATRRRHLHGRIARAILEHTGGHPAARAGTVAHHLAAAAPGETDPAVERWAVAAADHAVSQLAWESAETELELALAHTSAGASGSRVDLVTRLATANRLAGHESLATTHFAQAVDLARRIDDTDRVVDVMLAWTSTPVDVRRELDDVIARLRGVLDEIPAIDDARRAQLMARLAFSLGWANDDEARTIADDAVAIARHSGDPNTLARALLYSTSSRDQFEAYDPNGCAGELRALVTELDDPALAASAQFCWLVGCIQRGDQSAVDDARHILRELAERHRLIEARFRLDTVEGHLALGRGDIDAAERAADNLLARAAGTDLRNLFLFAASLLYDVRRAQGRLAELLPWFDEVHTAGERIARVAAMRVQVLAAAGRAEAASDALRALVADDLAAISPAERPHSVATLAEVAVQLGDADAAATLRRTLEPWSGLIVYDGTNGPLEPVDRYLTALDSA